MGWVKIRGRLRYKPAVLQVFFKFKKKIHDRNYYLHNIGVHLVARSETNL